jgi:hypothetical protein
VTRAWRAPPGNRAFLGVPAPFLGIAVLRVGRGGNGDDEIRTAEGHRIAHDIPVGVEELEGEITEIPLGQVTAEPGGHRVPAAAGIDLRGRQRGARSEAHPLEHLGAAARDAIGAGGVRTQETATRPHRAGHGVLGRIQVGAERAPPLPRPGVVLPPDLDHREARSLGVLEAPVQNQFGRPGPPHERQAAGQDRQPHPPTTSSPCPSPIVVPVPIRVSSRFHACLSLPIPLRLLPSLSSSPPRGDSTADSGVPRQSAPLRQTDRRASVPGFAESRVLYVRRGRQVNAEEDRPRKVTRAFDNARFSPRGVLRARSADRPIRLGRKHPPATVPGGPGGPRSPRDFVDGSGNITRTPPAA